MVARILKWAAMIVVLAIVILQFFAIDKAPLPIVQSETLEAAVRVPADISQILGRSCNDCHSHKTVYPWYSYVQPFGWFLSDHIREGRDELNLSKFNTYSADKKAKKLEEMCEEVSEGKMPLPSYLWIHRDAALSPSDVQAICGWAKDESSKLGGDLRDEH